MIIVSVCCVTYNHANYIKECLDGFVMQQTNFLFEILVHDDASTDGTDLILKEYEQRYPHLFRNVYQTENQFEKQNTLVNILFKMARGKYIALCEGDDYWTDPLKLQKQVDILEKHFEYSMVATSTKIINEITNQVSIYELNSAEFFFDDLVRGNILGHSTCSVVFRSNCIASNKIERFSDTPFGDWTIWLLCLSEGKGYFLPDVAASYRQHQNGIWSSLNYKEKEKRIVAMYDFMMNNFPDNKEAIEVYRRKYIFKNTEENKVEIFSKAKKFSRRLWRFIKRMASK